MKALEVTRHIRVHKEADGIRFTLDGDVGDPSGDKPGAKVTGTTDIEADLKFDWTRPKFRFYWSLQYKF